LCLKINIKYFIENNKKVKDEISANGDNFNLADTTTDQRTGFHLLIFMIFCAKNV